MLDLGFWELILVMIVALLVVGPKRLPQVAAQAGRTIGRLRRLAQQFRDGLQQELRTEELRRILHKQQDEIQDLRKRVGGLPDAAPPSAPDPARDRPHD